MTEHDVGFVEEERVVLEVGRLFLSAQQAADRIVADAHSAAEGLLAEARRQARESGAAVIPGNADVKDVDPPALSSAGALCGPSLTGGPTLSSGQALGSGRTLGGGQALGSGRTLRSGHALRTAVDEVEVELRRSRTALLSRIAELGEQGHPAAAEQEHPAAAEQEHAATVVSDPQSLVLAALAVDEATTEAAAPPPAATTSPFVDQAFRRDCAGLDAVLWGPSAVGPSGPPDRSSVQGAGGVGEDHPPAPTGPTPPDSSDAGAATTTNGFFPPAAIPVGPPAVRIETGYPTRPAWMANVVVAMVVLLGLAGVLALTNV